MAFGGKLFLKMLILESWLETLECFQDAQITELEEKVTASDAAVMNTVDTVADLETRVDALEAVGNPVVAIAGIQEDVTNLQNSVTMLETLPATVTTVQASVTANCQKIKQVTDVAETPGTDNDAILTNILAVESPVCV